MASYNAVETIDDFLHQLTRLVRKTNTTTITKWNCQQKKTLRVTQQTHRR